MSDGPSLYDKLNEQIGQRVYISRIDGIKLSGVIADVIDDTTVVSSEMLGEVEPRYIRGTESISVALRHVREEL